MFDPKTGKFTPTGSMAVGRAEHTATLLADGRVLITGGFSGDLLTTPLVDLGMCEIYDPATGKFTVTGSMSEGRSQHTATLLQDGRVLVAGGGAHVPAGGDGLTLSGGNTAELYDPTTGVFTPTGLMVEGRDIAAAVLLQDGRVLVAGGISNPLDETAELYVP